MCNFDAYLSIASLLSILVTSTMFSAPNESKTFPLKDSISIGYKLLNVVRLFVDDPFKTFSFSAKHLTNLFEGINFDFVLRLRRSMVEKYKSAIGTIS